MLLMFSNAKLEKKENSYIIVADSRKFGDNEIIFQSPIEADVERFVKENNLLVRLYDNTEVTDLRNREDNKTLIGYFRMYYRGGWHGKWFLEKGQEITSKDINMVQHIIDFVANRWDKGCDYFMKDDCKESFAQWGDVNRYLVQPMYNDNYLLAIDTTYGNGDYPIRIYAYNE